METHLHLPANALFWGTTPALKLDREVDLDLDDCPEDPRQEGSFGLLLVMGIMLRLHQALNHNHGAPLAHKLGVGGLLVQVFDDQGLQFFPMLFLGDSLQCMHPFDSVDLFLLLLLLILSHLIVLLL